MQYAWKNDLSGDRVVMLLTLTHQQSIFGRRSSKAASRTTAEAHRKGRLGDNPSIKKKKVARYKDFFCRVKRGLPRKLQGQTLQFA
jgi:hypothetical protein